MTSQSARIHDDDGLRVIGLLNSAVEFHERVLDSENDPAAIEDAAREFGVAIAHYFTEESAHLDAAKQEGQTNSNTLMRLVGTAEESPTFLATRYAFDLADIVWPDREVFSDRLDAPENTPVTAHQIYDELQGVPVPGYAATADRIESEICRAVAFSQLSEEAQAAALLRLALPTSTTPSEAASTIEQAGSQQSCQSAHGSSPVAVEGHPERQSRRPCYERDHLFLKWNEAEDSPTFHSPAKIRDKWNREHPNDQIGDGRSGSDVVRKGLQAARRDRQQEAGDS